MNTIELWPAARNHLNCSIEFHCTWT